jgi:hypothetical protein
MKISRTVDVSILTNSSMKTAKDSGSVSIELNISFDDINRQFIRKI